MTDHVREAFLEQQYAEGMALADASDLVKLTPVAGTPPERYLAEFRCRGLVRNEGGEIVEADHFSVGIWFPDDYLREADPFVVLTWLRPRAVWHPNISNRAPFICVGRLAAATPLVGILYRIFEVITFARVTPVEDEALNREACAWARAHQHLLPVDRRPLKRRVTAVADFDVEPIEAMR